MSKDSEISYNVGPAQRWLLFLCVTVICYLFASVVSWVVMRNGVSPAKVYISTMVQDVMLFILPALLTALIITRRAADFLTLSERPKLSAVLLSLAALLASVPAMNVVVQWNAALTLPSWMGDVADWMRASEDSAAAMIAMMVNGKSVVSLIMLILVVGVLAGFSEELFFRGAIQRLMIATRVNPHVAVWATAFIFSAFHMQFFGFVPRLLLGAMFGYMAWWSGSVLVSASDHILNNVLAASVMWCAARDSSSGIVKADEIGTDSPVMCTVSLVVTFTLLFLLYRSYRTRLR